MAFEHEQELISEFIRNFDPGEFSSAEDLVFDKKPTQEQIRHARKFKARIQRKKQMEESFSKALESELTNDSDVMITQDQIDELLEKGI